MTPRPETTMWITKRVVPCRNRTCYTLRGSRLPGHRANRTFVPIVSLYNVSVVSLVLWMCKTTGFSGVMATLQCVALWPWNET
ncbi:hypothetical protein SFRURICE_009916 [Spodoptera frugiperda]|nr:hypothetical protein SFRURICE_009916 [Spodoptera frugiperda]